MSDIGDAIGSAVEGAAYARAVEPKAGGQAGAGGKGHFHESACLNCGTPLSGNFCAECGQAAHLHRTMGAFLHDLSHGVLHLEGKTWRTLPMLIARPGELTRRYIAGERARFVSPMAVFLFTVFFMFALFQVLGISAPTELTTPTGLSANFAEAKASLEREQAAAQREVDAMAPDDPQRPAAEKKLADTRETLAVMAKTGKVVISESDDGNWKLTAVKSGWQRLDHGVEKAVKNPGLMLYKLQSNSYKFSWLLIPLSLPFMWLLFAWKRRFGFYDHAVFVTYSIAFMSLLLIVLTVLGQLGIAAGTLALVGLLIPPVHIYRQLRGAYGLSRFSALWRLVALLAVIVVVLVLFVSALILLGLVG